MVKRDQRRLACGWSEPKSPRCPVGRSAGLDIPCRMIKEPKIVYLHGPPGAARSRKDWVASWVLTAARIWRHVTPFGGALFCELGPAGTDHAIGIFSGHLDDAVLSDGDASAGERLDRADPWRRLEADIDRLRRFQFFGHFSVVLEDALAGERLLEPVEELGGG